MKSKRNFDTRKPNSGRRSINESHNARTNFYRARGVHRCQSDAARSASYYCDFLHVSLAHRQGLGGIILHYVSSEGSNAASLDELYPWSKVVSADLPT